MSERRLKRVIRELGYTNRIVAQLSGVGEGRLSEIASGRATPRRDSRTLVRLASVLGVPPAEAGSLLDEVDETG